MTAPDRPAAPGGRTGVRAGGAPRGNGARRDERVKILLVDDRPENLLALEAILEPLGQELVRATSGDEALRYLLASEVAVILLDVQMPGLNGFETAQLIKSRERSRYIPIIFLTAISKEEEYVFKGYSVGAVDYMFKPFQPDILRSKVAVFVDLYLKQKQLQRQEQMLRESERREMELRHVTELQESEARLAEVVDSAMDAIVMFDGDGRITIFNAAAERMFRVPAAQMIGRDVAELFPARYHAEYRQRLASAGGIWRDDDWASPEPLDPQVEAFTGVRASGEEFPIEASVSCLELETGKICTLIARDITDRVRAEEALRAQAVSLASTTAQLKAVNQELSLRQGELEKAMAARSRFYASMSHELRTPINAILGYNTLLLERIYGALNDKQAQGLERTQRAAKHLLELVNDVLDLSKIEAGKMELNVQPVRFPTLIEDLFVTVRPLADEHRSEVTLRHEGEPLTVMTDPRRVRQILLNLLSNAIKFGEGKPIHVASVPTPDGGIEISVVDHGTGIAAEDLPRIFDEFVQLSQPRQQEGTGLGLPISRRLAGLLHGRLEATSTLGEGSTFRLVLPPSVEHRPEAAAEPPAAEPSEPPVAALADRAAPSAAPDAAPGRRAGPRESRVAEGWRDGGMEG